MRLSTEEEEINLKSQQFRVQAEEINMLNLKEKCSVYLLGQETKTRLADANLHYINRVFKLRAQIRHLPATSGCIPKFEETSN